MPKYMTVVYTIHDDDAFAFTRNQIFDSMQNQEGQPFYVSAISNDHEIRRLEFIEDAPEIAMQNGLSPEEVLEAILQHADVGNVADTTVFAP